MITTVTTTTTTTTTVVASNFATVAGIIAVVTLIAFLVAKELLSSATVSEAASGESGGLVSKAKLLVDKSNIAIFSLLFVFAAIVTTRVLEVLG